MIDNELYHHGVLGMKWGRRKQESSSGGNKKTRTNKISKRINRIKNAKTPKKKIKSLSDEELQKKINRLQMEKRYRDLRRDEISEGANLVGSIIKGSAKVLGTQLIVGTAGLAINKAMGENIINVGGKKKDKK